MKLLLLCSLLLMSFSSFSSVVELNCKSLNGGETIKQAVAKKYQKLLVETTTKTLGGCYEAIIEVNTEPTNPVYRLDLVEENSCLYLNLQSEFGLICSK